MFKSNCEELGRTIKVSELRKHEFGLPDSNWFVRNCPDLDVKFYRDFIEYLGYKNSHRKYTYEIAYEEFAKRGLILLPQEYKSCAIPLAYICPKHPNIIQYKTLNNLIFGSNLITEGGCYLCFLDSQRGSGHNSWKGGSSALNPYLRDFIKEWKKESAKNCNYKCIITGKIFDDIHHLYSFNKILKEIIEESNLPIYTTISDYTEEELNLLKETNIKIHNKYPLGVCLCKEVHDLYHNLYGDDNTPEQFEEFRERYNSGEFNVKVGE